MLISINGTIIDTKRIYKIEPIKVYCTDSINICYSFLISFNNTENMEVISKEYDTINYRENSDFINFRDSIIKIWQENQSEIPKFNL